MNVQIDAKSNELVIRIPLQQPAPSASGKTLIVASSRGNVATTAVIHGQPVVLSVNAYIRKTGTNGHVSPAPRIAGKDNYSAPAQERGGSLLDVDA